MRRTELLQEVRIMRFEEAYSGWNGGRLSQAEAALMLGVSERTFRRYIGRYEEDGLEGLADRRLEHASPRAAPVDEALALTDRYRQMHIGWNVKHFHSWYQRAGGRRSYTWVKLCLQKAGLVKKTSKRGAHRKKRERMPLPGMMLHQDASTHAWIKGEKWDLVVTLDDATGEHYDMRFVPEEGTASSMMSILAVIEQHGLFSSLYTDRGSHYWTTIEAGGRVDKAHPTQFGRALRQLGIEMIAAYSPEARGRSERAFGTHQGRLPQELAHFGIRSMELANRYLREVYLPAFNAEFASPAQEPGTAFIPYIGNNLANVLCEHYERTVGNDNCVTFGRLRLQIPVSQHRCHFVKAKVRVHCYPNGDIAVFHGPRRLADYDANGTLLTEDFRKAA